MTAGVPLYLVSACESAEEFVAAFRRYADRTGLFVPIAEPLPAGRRGRIALALKGGGVMIDGEAEVVASSQRASGIHARVGMTLKWLEPDEPSKIVIAELEKARLAMKPAPPSVPPRPVELPAQPRAVPPPSGGRIDAANALAECVLIGDAAAFRDGASPPAPGDEPTKTGLGKFVIPSIPPTGRPKAPTTPPALTPSTPPALTKPTAQIPAIKPITPPAGVLAKVDATAAVAKPGTPPTGVAKPGTPTGVAKPGTPTGVAKPGTPPTGVAKPGTPPTGVAKPGTTLGVLPLARPPKGDDGVAPRATRIGFPAIKLPAMEAPAVIVAMPPTDDPPPSGLPFTRATPPLPMATVAPARPAGPPMPRQPTPFTPLPIVRLPAADALVDPEKTDLTDVPQAPPDDAPHFLGVAVVTAVARETSEPTRREQPPSPPPSTAGTGAQPAAPPQVPSTGAVEPASIGRSGGMRASQLMAAIQGEDWTMTPDAPVETVNSTRPTVPMDARAKRDPASEPSGPLGDWSMSADPTSAGGWTPPAKVEVIAPQPAPKGNRVFAVASAEPLNAVEWEDKPTGIGEPLVEIDPTLVPIATSEPTPDTMRQRPAPPPLPNAPMPPMPFMSPPMPLMPPPMPGAVPMPPVATAPRIPPPLLPGSFTPPPGALRMPGASQPAAVFSGPPDPMAMFGGPMPPDPMDSTSLLTTGKRKRRLAIAAGATAVVAAGAIAMVASGAKGKPSPGGALRAGSAGSAAALRVPPAPDGSATTQAIRAGSAAPAAETPAPANAGTPTPCKLDVASIPDGAEVWLDNAQIGVTPTTLHLPCGVEARLLFKKARVGTAFRAVTPSVDTTRLAVRIAVPSVSLRVMSTPPGATILLAGRVLGITPTTIHVPATGATLTLTKEGYLTDTERIAGKQNATHRVTLRRRTH